MSITNRPFVGTWALNNRGVVRVTPDSLVYLNGNLEVAGCPTCGGRIDIQKYISSVTVDCGVETGSGSASISMHVPRTEGFSLFRDGQFILRPGLEVNIYERGYFPVQGLLAHVAPEQSGGVDVRGSVMYPYYHVFHGVVTETSFDYAGGEHTATLTCKDMLHFWSYQMMSTSGAAFGARPHNSGIKFSLIGHTFTAMTPYSIVYTLYRDVMGAAGGVGFALGSATNGDAKTETGVDMWSYALLYWEQRFSQNFNTLRMYGMDGTLYNAYQQAFLGRLSTAQTTTLAKAFNDPALRSTDYDLDQRLLIETARSVGYDVASTYVGAAAEDDAAKGGLGINVNQMQAFLTDISAFGQVNLWESVYESKMDIVQAVTRLTGFEFYQDVDGDFVFKPPFYNLDTSSSRVYVLKDIDIISINFAESEPRVTSLKVTSGHFGNITGLGLEGNEWGTRSAYIDYRLVAQFGWRQDTFECAYLTDPKAMLYACAARMDLFNIEMHRANCQIPLRPELRPGMPVYLEPFDCFYYLQSFSHTLSYGAQCTTNLTLVGRRAKFFAPGIAPEDGTPATADNIKLTDPWLPPLPIEVVGNDGIPRLQGFPNVVMAIDTELLNPNFFSVGLNIIDTEAGIQALIRKAKDFGILDFDPELTAGKSERAKFLEGPFVLRTGADTYQPIPSPAELLAQALSYQQAYQAVNPGNSSVKQLRVLTDRDLAEQHASDLQAILDRVLALRGTAIEDGDQTANYLDALSDLKASFSPGNAVPGYYRYYSSSHPDPVQQGMKDLAADAETVDTTQAAGLILLESPTSVLGFRQGTNLLEQIDVSAGLPLMRPNTGAARARAVPTPTHQIATLSFAQTRLTKDISIPVTTTSRQKGYPKQTLIDVMTPQLRTKAAYFDDSATTAERFADLYTTYADVTSTVFDTIGLVNRENLLVPTLTDSLTGTNAPRTDKKGFRGLKVDPALALGAQFDSVSRAVEKISVYLAGQIAAAASTAFQRRFDELKGSVGGPGRPLGEAQTNADAYLDLDRAWADYVFTLVPQDQVGSSQGTKNKGLTVQVPSFNRDMAQYTPVFPVSDERGYEVVGAYAYGRGLSIEPGGNFEQLQNSDAFANVTVDAIESFLGALRKSTSPSKALGVLAAEDPRAAAELAAAAGTTLGQVGEEVRLAGSTNGNSPTQFDNAFNAFVASSRDFSQKLSVANAAFGLADLGLTSTREVCSCKGAEADLLLMAFGEDEFLSIDQPDEVSAWLADRALAATGPWQQAQNAMRGETMDVTGNTLMDQFQGVKGTFLSGLATAAAPLQEAGPSLSQAGADIASDAAGIVELGDDASAFVDFFNPNPDEG